MGVPKRSGFKGLIARSLADPTPRDRRHDGGSPYKEMLIRNAVDAGWPRAFGSLSLSTESATKWNLAERMRTLKLF